MENTIKENIIRVAPAFSEEEMKAIESAGNREIVFDADCPLFSITEYLCRILTLAFSER